jgi:crotonobetainyl-CoA:carnitine CoA-transferase CaiB-like acyl-CoA transferase
MGPLDGIRVVELCGGIPNAQLGQMLADFGADVVQVEPPGGAALRSHPSYPLWGRGKRSIELDLKAAAGLADAQRLAAVADVWLEAFRPGSTERLGLDYERLAAVNPRLVYSSVTGWGRQGRYRHAPGYEGLVMATLGTYGSYSQITERPGPGFVTVAYASWAATMVAFQGILAALYEREGSGRGQLVEVNLAAAVGALDPWNQTLHMIGQRFPDAFSATPAFDDDGVPSTSFPLRLLVAATSDGHWLQFSQVQPRLFNALLAELDLDWMLQDPEWSSVPEFADSGQRVRMLEMMLEGARRKTLAEWQAIFDRNPNVFAEVFRKGSELLHHPQVAYDELAVEVVDLERGRTLQPAPLVSMSVTPGGVAGPAPVLGADRDVLEEWQPTDGGGADVTVVDQLPLRGVTILELGTFFAAPYGATLLTDLGARVIKIEPLEGDPMRMIASFPEAGAAKVLQGKESLAVDIATPEGREVVIALARRSTAVLRSYRAGVAERLGLDADSLLAVNPDLVYLDAPGYGVAGPYGHRPAFAPTISAGSGAAMRNVGGMALGSNEGLSAMALDEVRIAATRLTTASNTGGTQPDGIAALAVGSALMLGLYAKRRGHGGQRLQTTMLLSTAHALSETMVEYEGKRPVAEIDPLAYGLGARYRLYEAEDGWVFLAAPSESEWARLAAALLPYLDLSGDRRWSTEAGRAAGDATLADLLAGVFAKRAARDWEHDLLAANVGCVVVDPRPMEACSMGELAEEGGYLTEAVSPVFDTYTRLAPLVRFSSSKTQALGGSTLGQHTDAVLRELGYDAATIDDLRRRNIIGPGGGSQ